jgi:hypothetical protein
MKKKLSNVEKREAVQAALAADVTRADRDIARAIGVSHTYVAKLRAKLTGNVATPDAGKHRAESGAKSKATGSVATDEAPRAMFMNLGAGLADSDTQWLLEACEVLVAMAKPAKKKRNEYAGMVRGRMGVVRAYEAINCLKQILPNDELRNDGFRVVADWIKHNQ